MDKINALTLEQEQQMVAFREQWRAIGMATGAANRAIVTPIIENFYAAIGKEKPHVWYCQSPIQIQLILNLRDNLGDNLRDNLGDNLRDNLGDNLGANLGANLGDNLRDNLQDNLRDNLRDNLQDNLGANLRANLRANLGANLRDNLGANQLRYFPTYVWGALDAYWVAYYLYPQKYLKADIYTPSDLSQLRQWGKLAENAFWVYPFEKVCFVSDRPSIFNMENQNGRYQLHSDNAPAIGFSDGYEHYYYKGVHVEEQIIMQPDTITVGQIQNERNAEVRRVMLERYRLSEQVSGEVSGEALFIKDVGIEPQASDEYGTVYLKSFSDDEALCYVKVTCPSTARVYWLRVDPSVYDNQASINPQAAVASTWRRQDGSLFFADWRDYAPVEQS
jgi:hypothetical protein